MAVTSGVLDSICCAKLGLGDDWSVRDASSWTWWPSDLVQRIRIHPEIQGPGDDFVIHVETDVLTEVPTDEPAQLEHVLSGLNARNALSTLALGKDGVLRLWFSLRVRNDTLGWIEHWAARLCACQAADALDLSTDPETVHANARRAVSHHPTNGPRPDVDAALVLRNEVTWASHTRGTQQTIDTLRAGLTALGVPVADVDRDTVTVTRPWVIDPQADDGRWEGRGELRTIAAMVDHETWGASVLVTTWPAYDVTPENGAFLAAAANEMGRCDESFAPSTSGTWISDPLEPGIAVRTVIPVGMVEPDGAQNLAKTITAVAHDQARRCTDLTRVMRTFAPQTEDGDPYVAGTRDIEACEPTEFGFSKTPTPAVAAPAPARRLPPGMVESYVETLIERMTSTRTAVSDADGDYPIWFGSAVYYVRVLPRLEPVVQFFAIALADVELTPELALDLNEINSQLQFCRIFWVRKQVLVEAEHLALTLDEGDFRACCDAVAVATDRWAEPLARHHGGQARFEETKGPDYTSPDDSGTGLYL